MHQDRGDEHFLPTTWGTSARRRLVLEERMTLLQLGHLEANGSYLGSKRSGLKGHNKPVCARLLPFTPACQNSILHPKNGEGIAAVVGGTNIFRTMALI